MNPIAVIDACVLFPPALRDFIVRLGVAEAFRPRWTDTIHEEWISSVLTNRRHVEHANLERCRRLMDGGVLGSLIQGHEYLIPTLELPDPDDRHVLAAAIHGEASHIVTFNLKDFPRGVLASHGIEAVHPDDFVSMLLDESAGKVVLAVSKQRASLKKPPKTVEEYLESLVAVGLPKTAARLALVGESL